MMVITGPQMTIIDNGH